MLPTILIKCFRLADEESYYAVQSHDFGPLRDDFEVELDNLLLKYGFNMRDVEIDPYGGV